MADIVLLYSMADIILLYNETDTVAVYKKKQTDYLTTHPIQPLFPTWM